MRDVSMSGASGHGEEPMADPASMRDARGELAARQSHLPKIRDDSVDRHKQIGLRYGSRSSTIGPTSSRLKRKPASSRARRQAADRVLMCTGFWRPPAKSPSVRCREPRACASCLPHQGRELWLLDCARLCPYWSKKGNHLRSSRRRPVDGNGQRAMSNTLKSGTKGLLVAVSVSAALFLNAQAAIALQSSPPISSEKIAQIVTSSDRTVADRANDVRRKPEQTLGFIGIHSPYRRGRSQPGRRNVANEALLTIVAAASIHSHWRGDHHEG
jgi:hypothetical protein